MILTHKNNKLILRTITLCINLIIIDIIINKRSVTIA